MNRDRIQFYALYLTRFAGGYGFITLITLLSEYIDTLDPTTVSVFGLFTVGTGFVVGMYTTGFTGAQTLAVVPLAWAGDRFDKGDVLVGVLALGTVAYALFVPVDSSLSFIAVRALQGVAVTGAGLMSLALVGELSAVGSRANNIGKANASAFAASILGSLLAGALYDTFGFTPIFAVIVVLMAIATVTCWLFLGDDDTRVRGFPFMDLALNRRILTIATFRAQYAVAVTLVRTWIPIYAGVSASTGGLAYASLAVSFTVVAEKFTNMLCQPRTGTLSDRYGRALFVFVGGGAYGLVALAVPFSSALGLPSAFPVLGALSPAFLPLVALSGLLGVADSFREPASMALFADEGIDSGGVASSFGIRELLWRPGSVVAPLLGGWLMYEVGIEWVFFVGGAHGRADVPRRPRVRLRPGSTHRVVSSAALSFRITDRSIFIPAVASLRLMFRADAPPEEAYERLRKALRSLPEGVVSLAQVTEKFQEAYGGLFPDLNVPRAIQDLIVLGEVELCSETESGARVWLRHRWGDFDSDDRADDRLVVAGTTWRSYVAPDFRRRRADRLFTTRSAAFDHLRRVGGVDAAELEPVWFLEDVWAAGLESGETAVVRRDPVYERESVHGDYYEDASDFGA